MSCSLFGWNGCSCCSCSRKSCSSNWIFLCGRTPDTPIPSPTSRPFLTHPLSHPITTTVAKADQVKPLIIVTQPTDDEKDDSKDDIMSNTTESEAEDGPIDVKKKIEAFNSFFQNHDFMPNKTRDSVPKRSSSCSSSSTKPVCSPKPTDIFKISANVPQRESSPLSDINESLNSITVDKADNKGESKNNYNNRKMSAPAMRSPSSVSSGSSASSSTFDSFNLNNNVSLITELKEKLGIIDTKDIKIVVSDSTASRTRLPEGDESSPEKTFEEDDSVKINGIRDGRLTHFVRTAEKKTRKLFFIAHELTTSEEIFVDTLNLLNVEFRSIVHKYLPPEIASNILKHLNEISAVSIVLLGELQKSLRNWPETQKISHILVTLGPFLKVYSTYMGDFDAINKSLDDAITRFPYFSSALKDFEASPRCKKLLVRDYLLKPVQRIPQYRLLLKDYLDKMTPDHPDFQDTQTALGVVSDVAEHANNTIKAGDSSNKLLKYQANLVRHQDIIRPGRVFIRDGILHKVSRKELQPRTFVLCSDALIYLSVVPSGLTKDRIQYAFHHEVPLTGMRVILPDSDDDYNNEFRIISPSRSLIVQADTERERKAWYDILVQTIAENARKRRTFDTVLSNNGEEGSNGISRNPSNASDASRAFSDSGLPRSPSSPIPSPSFVLGEDHPIWIPDERVTMCQLCTREFTLTFRRHHCRSCGKVVCDPCSANSAPLKYLNYKADRVCDECLPKLKQIINEKKERRKSVLSLEQANNASDADDETSDIISQASTLHRSSSSLQPIAQRDSVEDYDEIDQRFGNRISRQSGRKPKKVPNAFKLPANESGCDMKGYLLVRKKVNNWKKQWFVIKDKVLYRYREREDPVAFSTEVLLGWKVEELAEVLDGFSPDTLFKITHVGRPTYYFKAEKPLVKDRWVKIMNESTVLV